MNCTHKTTYAVDTHDRIDCADCEETIVTGQQAVRLRTELAKAREALRHCGTPGGSIPEVVAREALRSIDESGLLSTDANIRT